MKILKNNFFLLLSLFAVLMIFILSFSKYYNEKKSIDLYYEETKINCSHEKYDRYSEEYCNQVVLTDSFDNKTSFYSVVSNTLSTGLFRDSMFFLPIFILIPSLVFVCNYLKNKIITLDLTRISYKQSLKKILKNAYKSVIIFPIIFIILFILSYIICDTIEPVGKDFSWQISNIFVFIVSYLVHLSLFSLVFINIGLIVARFLHNYYICLVGSYLACFAVEVLIEVVLEEFIINRLFKVGFGSNLSLFNFVNFKITYNISFTLFIGLFYFLISFFIVLLVYRNKEKLVISCERG